MIFGLVIVASCMVLGPVWSQTIEVTSTKFNAPTSRAGLSTWCSLDKYSPTHPAAPAQCCSAAYQCSVYIDSGSTKYGIENKGPWTKRHCDCDMAFQNCLVNNLPFNDGLKVYFEAMRMTCLVNKSCNPPSSCKDQYETMNFGVFRNRALADDDDK